MPTRSQAALDKENVRVERNTANNIQATPRKTVSTETPNEWFSRWTTAGRDLPSLANALDNDFDVDQWRSDEVYIEMWLERIRQDNENMKAHFKFMKLQSIGRRSAAYYMEMARNHPAKAMKFLTDGVMWKAEPTAKLQEAIQACKAGVDLAQACSPIPLSDRVKQTPEANASQIIDPEATVKLEPKQQAEASNAAKSRPSSRRTALSKRTRLGGLGGARRVRGGSSENEAELAEAAAAIASADEHNESVTNSHEDGQPVTSNLDDKATAPTPSRTATASLESSTMSHHDGVAFKTPGHGNGLSSSKIPLASITERGSGSDLSSEGSNGSQQETRSTSSAASSATPFNGEVAGQTPMTNSHVQQVSFPQTGNLSLNTSLPAVDPAPAVPSARPSTSASQADGVVFGRQAAPAGMDSTQTPVRTTGTRQSAAVPSDEATIVKSQPHQSKTTSKQAPLDPEVQVALDDPTVKPPSGYLRVNKDLYKKLGQIGKGGMGKVFRASRVPDGMICAVKRIKWDKADRETRAGVTNEINLLSKLRGKNHIIQMFDCEIMSNVVHVVMECGDYDLAHALHKHAVQNKKLNIRTIKGLWRRMLEGVETVHAERVVHGDLKPANFLFVQDELKLIDFGIAKAISGDTTNIQRDNAVGTLNYMAPESFDNAAGTLKQGRASDVWSLGCILYQMIYGKPPFHAVQNVLMKIKAITDKKHEILYPGLSAGDPLLEVLRGCLNRDPTARPSISQLIGHPFLHSSPKNDTAQAKTAATANKFVLNAQGLKQLVGWVRTAVSGRDDLSDDFVTDAIVKALKAGHFPPKEPLPPRESSSAAPAPPPPPPAGFAPPPPPAPKPAASDPVGAGNAGQASTGAAADLARLIAGGAGQLKPAPTQVKASSQQSAAANDGFNLSHFDLMNQRKALKPVQNAAPIPSADGTMTRAFKTGLSKLRQAIEPDDAPTEEFTEEV